MGEKELNLQVVARIYTDFPTKFGIPRQSGLTGTKARIVFEEDYRKPEAFRGLEEYSHLWLIWGFSEIPRDGWHSTVRPPRLGGNKRVGVFATRSPFRPNPVGLSSVRLEKIEESQELGIVLHVVGADLMDKTPIYDIKPYLPYVDSHPDAIGGFTDRVKEYRLEVEIPGKWLNMIPDEHREIVRELLAQDPRPSYQNDPERIYGMEYAGMDVKFRIDGDTAVVCGICGKCE